MIRDVIADMVCTQSNPNRFFYKIFSIFPTSVNRMLHGAMFLETSFAISKEAGVYFQTASFYWLLNRNIARQVARGMLQCAMAR